MQGVNKTVDFEETNVVLRGEIEKNFKYTMTLAKLCLRKRIAEGRKVEEGNADWNI